MVARVRFFGGGAGGGKSFAVAEARRRRREALRDPVILLTPRGVHVWLDELLDAPGREPRLRPIVIALRGVFA